MTDRDDAIRDLGTLNRLMDEHALRVQQIKDELAADPVKARARLLRILGDWYASKTKR